MVDENASFSGTLTIQKFIFLLSEFHYEKFTEYLAQSNSQLPLKLCRSVRSYLPHFQSGDELCKSVYGKLDNAHRKKFNQLASHTFRLSEFLSRNYNYYLHTNIEQMQRSAAEGHYREALFRAETLLTIADKVEDYACQLSVLNYLAAGAFAQAALTNGGKYYERIKEALACATIVQRLLSETWLLQNKVETPQQRDRLQQAKDYFLKFHRHSSAAVRMLSLHGYLKLLYTFDLPAFGEEKNQVFFRLLEKELRNRPYIVLPFGSDIKGSLLYMQLNSDLYGVDSKERELLMQELQEHYGGVVALQSAGSPGLLYMFAAEATRLFSLFHYLLERPDFASQVSAADRKIIDKMIQDCRRYLADSNKIFLSDYQQRSLKMILSFLLVMSGGKQIKEGLFELEALLIAYQQISFGASTDSIFLVLIVGYFALGDYDKCEHTFKRYVKVKKNKVVYVGNDVKIHTYYYLSGYLRSHRRQYLDKLKKLLTNPDLGGVPASLQELLRYHHIEW